MARTINAPAIVAGFQSAIAVPATAGLALLALNQIAYRLGFYEPRKIVIGRTYHEEESHQEEYEAIEDIGYWTWRAPGKIKIGFWRWEPKPVYQTIIFTWRWQYFYGPSGQVFAWYLASISPAGTKYDRFQGMFNHPLWPSANDPAFEFIPKPPASGSWNQTTQTQLYDEVSTSWGWVWYWSADHLPTDKPPDPPAYDGAPAEVVDVELTPDPFWHWTDQTGGQYPTGIEKPVQNGPYDGYVVKIVGKFTRTRTVIDKPAGFYNDYAVRTTEPHWGFTAGGLDLGAPVTVWKQGNDVEIAKALEESNSAKAESIQVAIITISIITALGNSGVLQSLIEAGGKTIGSILKIGAAT